MRFYYFVCGFSSVSCVFITFLLIFECIMRFLHSFCGFSIVSCVFITLLMWPTKCIRMLQHQNASECIRMLQNASECFRLLQNASECIRRLQNAWECFRMLQNALRMLQNASKCFDTSQIDSNFSTVWGLSLGSYMYRDKDPIYKSSICRGLIFRASL